MLDTRTEETKLLDQIAEHIQGLCPESGNEHTIWLWYNDYIDNKALIDKLLPLCKLLNKLFFNHPTFET